MTNNLLTLKKKILIADDSELNREMLTDILGDEYEYIYAEDGEEALNILAQSVRVDMILLDMNMPKIGGMHVLKAMRERGWLDEIPVVIISAENDDNFIKNAYYLGAADYIIRPFNAFLVQHRVKNTMTLYSQKKTLVKMLEGQVLQREKINDMMITIFSHVVEFVNSESGEHTRKVQTITKLLLKKLIKITDKYELSKEEISLISSVSALHDIGKIMISGDILNKPGKLTEKEWEIMKKHTINGDEFLSSIPVDQNEKLMKTAHEICLYHHERYDGGGYPMGLVGDEIPISAQAVALADVYDALTSDRCYKSAYSHEKAFEMIMDGECGAFNPLLLEAFGKISDDILIELKLNARKKAEPKTVYDYTSELFENEGMVYNERSIDIAKNEKYKKEFFADRCLGIQFEYNAILRKVLYIKHYNSDGEKILLEKNIIRLLNEEDSETLHRKLCETTRENPIVEMTVLVPINNDLRWHRLTAATIWSDMNSSYIGIIGHFVDIHDEMISKGANFLVDGNILTGKNFLAMRNIFDVVRIVNPSNCSVLKVGKCGDVTNMGMRCYDMWNRSEPCKNCTSRKALDTKKWMSKLEIKDGLIYSVLSRYVKYGDIDCVLEVAFCIDDSFEKVQNEIGFYPDSMALKNYYRDTLTHTYSRAYLESFMPNIEKAQGVAIADIDEFKKINDTFGHIVGDAALRHISKTIKKCIRKEDILIRYGGDEFLLIFNNISKDDFFAKLESIKNEVLNSQLAEYPEVMCSISIGGAYEIYPFETAMDTADKAMYKDKFRKKS